MKRKDFSMPLIMGVMSAIFISSCTVDDTSFDCVGKKDLGLQDVVERNTRSIVEDSVSSDELIILEETEEQKFLASILQRSKPRRAKALSYSADYDDFFSSNMLAIQEMPITIKVRSVASGSSSANSYFSCNGANKEVTLASSSTSASSKFFIKVLPASTGIPYMIYSNVSRTPLTVGYYKKNPDNKILMSASSDSEILYGCGWELIPASSKGYFAIQNESYLGQADPDNMWSVFYYVLEAKANNKIGYGQRVANKPQQEFLITPDGNFTVADVSYDLENATVSNSSSISVVRTMTNPSDFRLKKQIISNVTANETSYFSETPGYLKLNILSGSLKFARPVPVAGKAIIPDGTSKDASYSYATQNFSVTRADTTSIEMKPQSLLKLTVRFKTFNLSVPYVVTAKYRSRVVKIRGIWRGYAIANPQYNKPIYEPHFYDLESGEELFY